MERKDSGVWAELRESANPTLIIRSYSMGSCRCIDNSMKELMINWKCECGVSYGIFHNVQSKFNFQYLKPHETGTSASTIIM